MKKIDLLGMLHNLGFTIKESETHIWYAKKVNSLGHTIIFGSDDINCLYRMAVNSVAEPLGYYLNHV